MAETVGVFTLDLEEGAVGITGVLNAFFLVWINGSLIPKGILVFYVPCNLIEFCGE